MSTIHFTDTAPARMSLLGPAAAVARKVVVWGGATMFVVAVNCGALIALLYWASVIQ